MQFPSIFRAYFSSRINDLYQHVRTYVHDARKYKHRIYILRVHTHTFYIASVHSRILNILITGSLFHFPLDYGRYLHVVAAQLSCLYSLAIVFPRAVRVFLSPAHVSTYVPYVSAAPQKRSLCIPVRIPVISRVIIVPC